MIKKIITDAFFYLTVPLLMWNLFRENLGDYHTILYGMLPAVIYTLLVVIIQKEWNITGLTVLYVIHILKK
ncbi:MAG: hypothetical protein ACKVIM_07175 [Flavobacteriales bacterium]|jgi:hypothetical protein|tara:strand:- start:2187 stop:2399 length:213 start_codon:yes stop_codon:yes gene_type:complete